MLSYPFGSNFNPRSREGSDATTLGVEAASSLFQSTLPRRERLKSTSGCGGACIISIHAPAWGATCTISVWDADKKISIHAPAWGATKYRKTDSCYSGNFNPRSRMGSDLLVHRWHLFIFISIHAPAWGATCNERLNSGEKIFQSTLPHGERPAGVSGHRQH